MASSYVQIGGLTNTFGDGTVVQAMGGKQGEQYVSTIHGDYYTAAYRGGVYSYHVTGVTVPVVANNMVSVFGFYNPPNSGVNMELIDFDMGTTSVTVVVNVTGIYYSLGATAAAATFTTPATPLAGLVGSGQTGKVIPYSAVTHSGTPVCSDIMATETGVTTLELIAVHYAWNGRRIFAPGSLISVANSTAAGHASTTDLALSWNEVPV